jgi:hypothetical protein
MNETITDFIEFPPRDAILSKLREIDDSSEDLEELFQGIAERLAARTYERSASAFILIELVYDFEESHDGEWSFVLPRAIMSLTGDRDLALTALSAFNEIKDAIGPSAEPTAERGGNGASGTGPSGDAGDERRQEASVAELETQELFREVETSGEAPIAAPEPQPEPAAPSESDLLMAQLQNAQKALSDMGLSTRVSVDLAMRRSSKDRVSRTLQDISALRTALRRFEELLSRAELQVLESAGLLWGDEEE